jgi:hypothetical protein
MEESGLCSRFSYFTFTLTYSSHSLTSVYVKINTHIKCFCQPLFLVVLGIKPRGLHMLGKHYSCVKPPALQSI